MPSSPLPPPPVRLRSPSPLQRALGLLGELMITAGVLLGLFVAYSLWWTDVLADRRADADAARVRQSWSASGPTPGPAAPAAAYRAGDGLGFLHVPRLGRGYQVLIKMGTDPDVLDEGVAGVYAAPYPAAMPWAASGNFALAAHRDGHGAKFHDLPELRRGDKVVVETRDTWYVYTVDRTLEQTSKYDVDVTAAVPAESGYTRPGRYLTLTTCTPVYTSRYRMAVWASLTRTAPVDRARDLPPELR
ncbi:class E sortase [Streptacidiphilus sp. PB12-B1b]|uniref:class E sortase n=1 Tax=Streptacidiphilus sp. PB12-B1b TaxID=2705012 RepID=UPI0015F9577F|nr:class E sortase [Streptacidiphilus sp. PB12-B1b]QMU74429.1 class E sortase [Streptacidiphilus sp. PB12-B1b]